MLKRSGLIAFLGIALLYSSVAHAHPELLISNPAAGSTSAAPKEIRISFSEVIIAQFSGIKIKGPDGKFAQVGKAVVDPSNKKQLVAPVLGQLSPGTYQVEWHAVSDDTHRIKGTFSFSVAR